MPKLITVDGMITSPEIPLFAKAKSPIDCNPSPKTFNVRRFVHPKKAPLLISVTGAYANDVRLVLFAN